MSGTKGARSREVLVTSYGVVLFLADYIFEPAIVSNLAATLTVARRAALVNAMVKRHEIFEWTVVMDGTYKVRCVWGDDDIAKVDRHDPARGIFSESQELILPTGRLALRSAQPSAECVHLTQLNPGRYEVTLDWSAQEESKHYDIATEAEYPAGDGPDGVLTLRHIPSKP